MTLYGRLQADGSVITCTSEWADDPNAIPIDGFSLYLSTIFAGNKRVDKREWYKAKWWKS